MFSAYMIFSIHEAKTSQELITFYIYFMSFGEKE